MDAGTNRRRTQTNAPIRDKGLAVTPRHERTAKSTHSLQGGKATDQKHQDRRWEKRKAQEGGVRVQRSKAPGIKGSREGGGQFKDQKNREGEGRDRGGSEGGRGDGSHIRGGLIRGVRVCSLLAGDHLRFAALAGALAPPPSAGLYPRSALRSHQPPAPSRASPVAPSTFHLPPGPPSIP